MAVRDGVVVLVLLLVVVQPASAGLIIDETSHRNTSAAATEDEIVRTMTLSLTPEDPGRFDVEMSFTIPDSVVELTSGVPPDATVRTTDGFSDDGTGNYSWDGRTESPSITFAVPANRTGAYHYDGPSTGLSFVDTGPWAMVSVPSAAVSWKYRGSPAPTFVRTVTTDGAGVAGSRMAYLGPHESTTRTIDGQAVTLVVPEAATLEESREAILGSVANASASLQVGNRPSSVLLVAAPTSVDWGPYGLTEGSDAWVRADQRLDDPNNVWLHEYVHIRQDFRTTEDARWVMEATGEYYAASLALEQGHIGYEEFRDHLAQGATSRYDDTVLSRPETWDPLGNYVKGSLVYGDLDRRMRAETDGQHPASHLFLRMNERDTLVDHAFLERTVAELASDEVARTFDTYTTTDSGPEMWSRSDHTAAFSTLPPRIEAEVGSEYGLSGPYRNRSVDSLPTLVPGERLTLTATVHNEGEAIGEYELDLVVDGNVVATENGSLEGSENTTVRIGHTFDTAGEYGVELGDSTWNVTVEEPLTPTVTLSGPDGSVEPGQPVTIEAVLSNHGDRPAAGDLLVSVDGAEKETWGTELDAGQSETRTVTVTFDEPGDHEVVVGDASVMIGVTHQSTETTGQTATTTNTSTSTSTPGFGVMTGVTALVLALLGWMLVSRW